MGSAPPIKSAWITGASGLIGSYLLKKTAPGFSAQPITRERLDLTDFAAVERAYRADQPDLVIHCAAISKSPQCQADPDTARKVNVEMTRFLAGLAADHQFVFFSTDLVFDGANGDYVEGDPVNPLSVYAETKVAAEQAVLGNPKHLVIRTSLNGGTSPTGDRGFNEDLRRAWRQGHPLKLFIDEFRCPIAAEVTARAVWELAAKDCAGIYHVAGAEKLSRFQIGQLVARRWPDLIPKIQPGSLREYVGAPRAPDTTLNCDKAQAALSFPLPRLSRWLEEHPTTPF